MYVYVYNVCYMYRGYRGYIVYSVYRSYRGYIVYTVDRGYRGYIVYTVYRGYRDYIVYTVYRGNISIPRGCESDEGKPETVENIPELQVMYSV